MKIIAEFTIIPLGIGITLSSYIAEITKYLRQTNLIIEEHSMGTNIEGEWDLVMAAVKHCNQLLINKGVERVSTNLKISLRVDKEQSMTGKLKSVADKLS